MPPFGTHMIGFLMGKFPRCWQLPTDRISQRQRPESAECSDADQAFRPSVFFLLYRAIAGGFRSAMPESDF